MQEDFLFGRRLWRGARLTGRADTEPPVEEKVWLRGARPYPGFGMCRRELTTGFKSVNRQYYWLVSTGIMESFIPIRMPNVRQKIRFIKGGRKIKRKKKKKKMDEKNTHSVYNQNNYRGCLGSARVQDWIIEGFHSTLLSHIRFISLHEQEDRSLSLTIFLLTGEA